MNNNQQYPKEGWLKCKEIEDGIFPNEYSVIGETADNKMFSLFADKGFVNRDKNTLKVEILECNEGTCYIFLPSEPFEMKNTIKVNKENIEYDT
ncbi:hypothetical protein MCHI_000073 [Candidatus Magnetoovum chiemensis]|nr:hypothetical protein MCHI_000073 [Candidatus Magnetoovum chiemensis]